MLACVSILISQALQKYQKYNEKNLNLPMLFAFSLLTIFGNNLVSLGFIFCNHLLKLCYLDLAERIRHRLVPVGNMTLADLGEISYCTFN